MVAARPLARALRAACCVPPAAAHYCRRKLFGGERLRANRAAHVTPASPHARRRRGTTQRDTARLAHLETDDAMCGAMLARAASAGLGRFCCRLGANNRSAVVRLACAWSSRQSVRCTRAHIHGKLRQRGASSRTSGSAHSRCCSGAAHSASVDDTSPMPEPGPRKQKGREHRHHRIIRRWPRGAPALDAAL
jgi:hypothetical protein